VLLKSVVGLERRWSENGLRLNAETEQGTNDTHPVSDEVANPGEYFSGDDDSENDRAQSILREDDVRGGVGGIGCTLHGNTNVRVLQRRGVVDTIPCSAD
jgi:hypothetical protein